MSSFDQVIKEDISKKGVPQFVAKAIDSSGNSILPIVAGYSNVTNETPVQEDTVFWQASSSKILTSIATLQAVERGLITLDTDISTVIPEAASLDIVTAVEESAPGQPVYTTRKNTTPITLRQLLTHTAGFQYRFHNPAIEAYLNDRAAAGTIPTPHFLAQPLAFEAGTAWTYGTSLDWAGEVVARLNKTTWREYMKTNLFDPLGVKHTTHDPKDHPEIFSRLVQMHKRLPDGTLEPSEPPYAIALSDLGGAGLFSTNADMCLVFADLISKTPTLLKPETIGLLFEDQLNPQTAASFARKKWILAATTGFIPSADEDDQEAIAGHGLGGLFVKKDLPDWPKGTTLWGGAANTGWWMNKDLGVAGCLGINVMPFGDEQSVAIAKKWRGEVLEQIGFKYEV